MYVVYTADGIPYYWTIVEEKAERMSHDIGGYYVHEKYDFS